ncbi:MAG TPA: LysM peptidoglycan-binding domain-containing protein [Oceanospirillales bacterium]|nr:LysM peptidoglycan-binding domain-containing protein [Oceanospirillales bacterium]
MRLVILCVLVFISSSCRRHSPAPIKDVYHQQNKTKPQVISSQPLSVQNKFKPKYVTVKKGDTLYSIGFAHEIDYKTLAAMNNISAPYAIYPGQKLRLAFKHGSKNSTPSNVSIKPLTIKKPPTAVVSSKTSTKPIVKPTVKPVVKPTTKPATKPIQTSKPTSKPITKPITKPVYKPTITPNSNKKWIWPLKGKIISTFSSTDMTRKGIDIATTIGTPVYASNHGTVVYSGDGLRGYGELVIIKHSNNLLSAYAHNSSRTVKEGETVKQGQIIAKAGKGTDGKPLLHFEIRLNGQPVNPLKYLPKR